MDTSSDTPFASRFGISPRPTAAPSPVWPAVLTAGAALVLAMCFVVSPWLGESAMALSVGGVLLGIARRVRQGRVDPERRAVALATFAIKTEATRRAADIRAAIAAAGATPTTEAMQAIVSLFDASGLSQSELDQFTNVGVTDTLQRFRLALAQRPLDSGVGDLSHRYQHGQDPSVLSARSHICSAAPATNQQAPLDAAPGTETGHAKALNS